MCFKLKSFHLNLLAFFVTGIICLSSLVFAYTLLNSQKSTSDTFIMQIDYSPNGEINLASASSGSIKFPLGYYQIPETLLSKMSNLDNTQVSSQYCLSGSLSLQNPDHHWQQLSGSSSMIINVAGKQLELNGFMKKSVCISANEWQQQNKTFSPALTNDDLALLVASPSSVWNLKNGVKFDPSSFSGAKLIQTSLHLDVYAIPFTDDKFKSITFPIQISITAIIKPTLMAEIMVYLVSTMVAIIFSSTFLKSCSDLYQIIMHRTSV